MRLGLIQRLLCLVIVGPSVSACGLVYLGESDSDVGFSDFGSAVQFGSICGSAPTCSISDELCQNTVLRITACVRDDELPELPKFRVIQRDELRAELSDDDDDAPSRQSIAMRNALAALRLVAGDTSLAEAQLQHEISSISAFYRLDEQDITIVSDGIEDQREAMTTLAHELTHYLQDRAGQLDAVRGERASTDEQLARKALVEGDATLTSLRASVAMRGGQLASERWPEVLQAIEEAVAKETNGAESPLFAALDLLPYSISLAPLTAAWERGGHSEVDAYFDEPPSSALDWLHESSGSASASGPGPKWPEQAELQCYPPLAPEGYELVLTDSLGLLGVYALLASEERASILAASELRGDVIAVYAEKGAETTEGLAVQVVWRLAFEDEGGAERFADRIASTGLAITRAGAELTINVSSDPKRAAFGEQLLAACASREELEAGVKDEEEAAAARGVMFSRQRSAGSRAFDRR